mgnify:CR=1 FL=1
MTYEQAYKSFEETAKQLGWEHYEIVEEGRSGLLLIGYEDENCEIEIEHYKMYYGPYGDMLNSILDSGLETTLRYEMHSNEGQRLLAILFEEAFDRLSDDDYESLVLNVCKRLEQEDE